MWLLPTLNRTQKLKTFLKSVVDTHNNVEGLILVDAEDFLKNEADYKALEIPPGWEIKITKAKTMGGKCREVIPTLNPDTTYIGILNDDHFCNSEKCLELLVQKLDGKNFVSANDRELISKRLDENNLVKQNIQPWFSSAFSFPVTATAWSIGLLRALNWCIFPPFLEHLFIDNLWHQLGTATGSWRMVAGAIVEHHHVLFGKAQPDQTHDEVYGPEFNQGKPGQLWANDQANFQHFMNTEFQIAVQTIKQFQDFLPGQQWNPEFNKRN